MDVAIKLVAAFLFFFAVAMLVLARNAGRSRDRFRRIDARSNPVRFRLQIAGLLGMILVTGLLATGILWSPSCSLN
jgi:hypothetical protein